MDHNINTPLTDPDLIKAVGSASHGLRKSITDAARTYTQQMKEQEASYQEIVEFFHEVVWRMEWIDGDLTTPMAVVIDIIHQFQILSPGKVFRATQYHDISGDFHTAGITTLKQLFQIGEKWRYEWRPYPKTKDKWNLLCNIPNDARYRQFDYFMKYHLLKA